MGRQTSPHILGTSANLLGFCLFVITSLHVTDRTALSLIDEFASGIALLLALSSLLSFLSIKSRHELAASRLENAADILFIVSLSGILVILILLITRVII